jgi:hypothetical protein
MPRGFTRLDAQDVVESPGCFSTSPIISPGCITRHACARRLFRPEIWKVIRKSRSYAERQTFERAILKKFTFKVHSIIYKGEILSY